MFMGICYLANPLHEQIGSVFHEISHLLEPPNSIIAHSSLADHENAAHPYHEHEELQSNHDHSIIETLNSIFGASDDTESSNEPLVTKIKFDKHITTDHYETRCTVSFITQHSFGTSDEKVKKASIDVLGEPPQNFFF